jgi:murein DD-endopeptidase MepM/ murein hydrolase activator NlpD
MRAAQLALLAGVAVAAIGSAHGRPSEDVIVPAGAPGEARQALVRRQLAASQALRPALEQAAKALGGRAAALAAEQAAATAERAGLQAEAERLARQLDARLPRLLPRLAALERGRVAGLAALAAANGGTVAPAELARLQRATASLRLLRRTEAGLLARARAVGFRLPLVEAAARLLERDLARVARQRAAAAHRLRQLDADLARLAEEERALAAAPAPPAADPAPGAVVAIAVAADPAAQGATAEPPDGGAPALVAGWSLAPNGRADLRLPEAAAAHGADGFDVAFLQAAPAAQPAAREAPGVLEDLAPPLVPSGDQLGQSLAAQAGEAGQTAIAIGAKPRQRIAAPEAGKVVFAGRFRSYGLLLIIAHGDEYHTLMWGFSNLAVDAGQEVHAGQILGSLGPEGMPKLYVELRRNGQPVSPRAWLAASSSEVKG